MRTAMASFLFLFLLAQSAAGQPAPTSASPAQSGPNLVISQVVQLQIKEKGLDGKEVVKSIPAQNIKPGDILVYTLSYTNTGTQDAVQPSLLDEIPKNSVFVDASGAGADVYISIDGGKKFLRHPAMLDSIGPDGKKVSKPMPPERITHVRWVLKSPVKSGQGGVVTLLVKVK